MYKCLECGEVFEEDEMTTYSEDRGEWFGLEVSKKLCGCPNCHGAFEEAYACRICGECFLEKELENGFCSECIDKSITTDLMFEFLKEYNLFADFFHRFYWSLGESKTYPDDFKNECKELFVKKSLDDKITGRSIFLKKCKEYAYEDTMMFIDWLDERFNKKKGGVK